MLALLAIAGCSVGGRAAQSLPLGPYTDGGPGSAHWVLDLETHQDDVVAGSLFHVDVAGTRTGLQTFTGTVDGDRLSLSFSGSGAQRAAVGSQSGRQLIRLACGSFVTTDCSFLAASDAAGHP